MPAKIVKFSFTFFVLVSISSYTANLATILVTSAQRPRVQGIEDAIANQLSFCVLHKNIISEELFALYPDLRPLVFHEEKLGLSLDPGDIWRILHNKKHCQAAIVTDKDWRIAQSGQWAKADCKKESEGKLKAQEAVCKRKNDGTIDEERDCSGLLRVGGIVMVIPVAWPVSTRAENLRVAMKTYLAKGKWASNEQAYADRGPQAACPAPTPGIPEPDEDNLGMPAESMLGTLLISVAMIAVALLLGGVEHFTEKSISEHLGYVEIGRHRISGGDAHADECAPEIKLNDHMQTTGDKLAELEQIVQVQSRENSQQSETVEKRLLDLERAVAEPVDQRLTELERTIQEIGIQLKSRGLDVSGSRVDI